MLHARQTQGSSLSRKQRLPHWCTGKRHCVARFKEPLRDIRHHRTAGKTRSVIVVATGYKRDFADVRYNQIQLLLSMNASQDPYHDLQHQDSSLLNESAPAIFVGPMQMLTDRKLWYYILMKGGMCQRQTSCTCPPVASLEQRGVRCPSFSR